MDYKEQALVYVREACPELRDVTSSLNGKLFAEVLLPPHLEHWIIATETTDETLMWEVSVDGKSMVVTDWTDDTPYFEYDLHKNGLSQDVETFYKPFCELMKRI